MWTPCLLPADPNSDLDTAESSPRRDGHPDSRPGTRRTARQDTAAMASTVAQQSSYWELGQHTFPLLSTTWQPLISLPARVRVEQFTTRFVLRPRCFSRAFCLWPCRTASVVPMMAGQAAYTEDTRQRMLKRFRSRALAMAVKIPSTMLSHAKDTRSHRVLKQLVWSWDYLNQGGVGFHGLRRARLPIGAAMMSACRGR